MNGIWGSGPSDVWAVGFWPSPPPGERSGVVDHWDGHAWSFATPSNVDVWAVGNGLTHWDGHAWSDYPFDAGMANLLAIWGSASNDAWAAGDGFMLHWDGKTWSASSVPGPTGIWRGVWGSGPADVWAVGASYGSGSSAAIAHWDGAAWVMSTSSALQGVSALNGVWESGPTDVWAVGNAGSQNGPGVGAILHWDGHQWSGCTVATNGMTGVWGSGPRDVWAVGYGSSILHH
jgi:hypothetical protein